ncbi:MAG TPA: hypothetical protein PKG53_05070, partial [Bacillota bacterium]|nr:hypothetical protein [Bacillota bacterium]
GWKIDIKSSSQYSESADDYIEDEDLPVDYNDNIEEVELTDGEEMIPSEEDTAEKDAASEEVVEIDE